MNESFYDEALFVEMKHSLALCMILMNHVKLLVIFQLHQVIMIQQNTVKCLYFLQPQAH